MIFALFSALCGAVLGFFVGSALRGMGGRDEGLVVLVCAATGAVVGAVPPVPLPAWVIPSVGQGLGRAFGVAAVERGDTGVVVWHAGTWYAGGAYLRDPPPGNADSGAVAVSLTSGTLLGTLPSIPSTEVRASQDPSGDYSFSFTTSGIDVTVTRQAMPEGMRVLLRRRRGVEPLPDVVLDEGPPLYVHAQVSADRRHVLVTRQLSSPGPQARVRYHLTVFTADGAERVGDVETTDVLSSFVVVGPRLVSYVWLTGPMRADDRRSQMAVRAIDLRTGAVLFSHRVRDLRYRGPLPP
jgi:hypothetical protein